MSSRVLAAGRVQPVGPAERLVPTQRAGHPGTLPDTHAPTGVVRYLGTDDRTSARVRVVDAALRCIAEQGTRKTTVDDLARTAGLSRATVYRAFPGGRDAVLEAVVETEVARFFSGLAVVMGEAADLEDVLVAGMVEAARRLSSHAALAYLLAEEPEVILPHLAFAEMDQLLLAASAFTAPFFGRWLEPDQAARAAEWAVRIVVSYLSAPTPGTDLTSPSDTRRLVRTFVMPGIQALRNAAPGVVSPRSLRAAPRPRPNGSGPHQVATAERRAARAPSHSGSTTTGGPDGPARNPRQTQQSAKARPVRQGESR